MGILNFLITSIVGIIVIGVAFSIMDVAREIAPSEVQGTATSLESGVWFLKPSIGTEDLGIAVLVIVILAVFYGIFRLAMRKQAPIN